MSTTNLSAARNAMMCNLDIVRAAWESSHPHRTPLLDAAEMDAATVQFCHAAAPHLLDLVLLDRVQQPVIQGAGKGGIFEVLAGVALIATALALGPGFGLGIPGILGGIEIPLTPFIGAVGAALALGGISNLLSPQVQTNQNSYDIRGNVNTVAQGNPVPIGYDVTVFGNGQPQVTAPRTNGTSVYVAVSVNGPLTVICNPVEPDGTYGPGSTVHSIYIGAAP